MNEPMKILVLILFLCLGSEPVLAVDREALKSLSQACDEEYCRLRDRIVDEESSALPLLEQILNDESEAWNVRFVSGVCSERIRRKDDVLVFENADWNMLLHADSRWPHTAAGYQMELVPLYHDWLLEHGLWYSYLERASEMDGKMTTGLERTLDSFVLDHATGIHRWFAAKIAEAYALDYLEGRNPFCGSEVGRLRHFVLDGTLPSGVFVFLDRASDERKTSAGTLADYLPFVDDVSYLIGLAERCKETESRYHLIQRRIEELESEIQSASSTNKTVVTCSEPPSADATGRANENASSNPPTTEKNTTGGEFVFAIFGIGIAAFYAWKILRKTTRRDMRKGTPP